MLILKNKKNIILIYFKIKTFLKHNHRINSYAATKFNTNTTYPFSLHTLPAPTAPLQPIPDDLSSIVYPLLD
jgi:hypothetical protein